MNNIVYYYASVNLFIFERLDLHTMKTHHFLLSGLMALSMTVSISSSEMPNASQKTEAPAQSVDLGIRVVSSIAADGTVSTTAIGCADDADFMAAHPTAKPLYFATGNLIIDATTGAGRINTATETDLGLNNGLFGWADTTSANISRINAHYPSADYPTNISGNPAYDIARAKLGGNWRLPTANELAFLMQYVAKGTMTEKTWSSDSYGAGRHYSLWEGFPIAGITLISKVVGFTTQSIFMPSTGFRWGNSVLDKDPAGYYRAGYYRSGSFSDEHRSYYLSFYNGGDWYISRYTHSEGFSVRPVSE